MTRLFPVAYLFLPLVAGCCCCGGMGSGPTVAPEDLPGVSSLALEGVGDITVTVGSEPYSVNTADALGSSSELNGSELKITIGLGEGTASLPQLDTVTIGGVTGLNLSGVDVSDLTITKSGLGTVEVSGTATNVTVNANDDLCSIDLTGLTAENVTVNVTGDTSSVDVNATGTLNVTISGNGSTVSYTGGATLTENVTGSGSSVTNMDGDTPTDGDEPVDGETTDSDEPVILDGEGFEGAEVDPAVEPIESN